MTKFEEQLRAQLRDAAQNAPEFRGIEQPAQDGGNRDDRTTASSRKKRFRLTGPRLAAAAVAVAVAGTGVSWWAVNSTDSNTNVSGASCASVLHFHGHRYGTNGRLMRTPRLGQSLGTGVIPGCDDTGGTGSPGKSADEHLRIRKIPGINPDTAIFANGDLWTNLRFTATPIEVRPFFEPVACSSSMTSTAYGKIVGMDAQVSSDFHPRAPYTATVVVDHGPTPLLEGYSSVTLRVRVTRATVGGTDAGLLRAALSQGHGVAVSLKCDGPRFVATGLKLTSAS